MTGDRHHVSMIGDSIGGALARWNELDTDQRDVSISVASITIAGSPDHPIR